MLQELLSRLTDAGANGVNLKITQSGDRAMVIIQPSLNPMPYNSTPEGLRIHAAMQAPLIINAELAELDTELHVAVSGYLDAFEGGMQSSNVKEVITQHTAASQIELTAAKPTTQTKKKVKEKVAASPVESSTPAEPQPQAEQGSAQPAMDMSDFEALFLSNESDQ